LDEADEEIVYSAKQTDLLVVTGDIGAYLYGTTSFRARKQVFK
jgi:hypothetical protein